MFENSFAFHRNHIQLKTHKSESAVLLWVTWHLTLTKEKKSILHSNQWFRSLWFTMFCIEFIVKIENSLHFGVSRTPNSIDFREEKKHIECKSYLKERYRQMCLVIESHHQKLLVSPSHSRTAAYFDWLRLNNFSGAFQICQQIFFFFFSLNSHIQKTINASVVIFSILYAESDANNIRISMN